MKFILESKYLAPIFGILAYAGTLLLLLQGVMSEVIKMPKTETSATEVKKEEKLWEPPPQPAIIYEPTYREPSFAGKSWEFYNPELNKLQEELKSEKANLFERAQHYDMVEKRILEEKKELEKLRLQIENLKSEFNSFLLTSQGDQIKSLKKTAEIIRTMDKDKGVTLLMNMALPEVVRLMGFFTPEETADFLETMASSGEKGIVFAADISAGLRRSYLTEMIVPPEESPVDVQMKPADSDRFAGLADFYSSMGVESAYAILESFPDEHLLKLLLHMIPNVQQEFLEVMTKQGGGEARRAQKLAKLLHDATNDSTVQRTIKENLYSIGADESRKLRRLTDLLVQMTDDELLQYVDAQYTLKDIAKIFKHIEGTRQSALMLKVMRENTFGDNRTRELAELVNRLELEVSIPEAGAASQVVENQPLDETANKEIP